MRRFPYKKADAFTSGDSRGNPAAFLDLGEDHLSGEEMLKIAREHRGFVSEFIFLSGGRGRPKLDYYSSEGEIAFCGHGTVAVLYEIIRNEPSLLSRPEILIETGRKGTLMVFNRIPTDNAVFITAPEPEWLTQKRSRQELADALDCRDSRISGALPADCLDAGLKTLIIPMENLDSVLSVRPDEKKLKALCLDWDIDIILIFSLETARPEFSAHSRVFAPRFGYLEDPATGSGNSALGYYLMKNGLWQEERISVEQGSPEFPFNSVKLMKSGNSVLFGGKATLKIEGMYYL